MARIFITGSTDGLGLAAARTLMAGGHAVVLHARSQARAGALTDLAGQALGVVVGDLGSAAETRGIAGQLNAIGRMDAVIHNAGVYRTNGRDETPEGHPTILAVNTLAPYLLTALIERARQADVHVMVGCIDASNAGSIGLHQRLGFSHSGTFPQVGFKFGRWLDAAFYQLTLDTPSEPVDG